jgi:uncharacterized membrane protein
MKTHLTAWAIPALSALGLADASYLSLLHFNGELPPCGGYAGCAEVNLSPYAVIYGMPVAALGALLYAALLGIALFRRGAGSTYWGRATLALYGLSLSGAVFLSYLTGIELFVLHAVCFWCIALALITFVLLVLVIRELWAIGSRQALPT